MKSADGRNAFSPALIGAGLVAAVLLVYLRALWCGWVAFDDLHHVLANPVVRNGVQADAIVRAFTTAPASLWIPVTWLSFMVEVSIFGTRAWGFHLGNVLLHAANAVLLWRLLEKSTSLRWPSVLVAALFAFHPLNVESVAWITERKNTLSTLFWLLSLHAWVAYGRGGGRRSYLVSVAMFLLGGMAKPMIVTLPATLLLLDWWPLDRWRTVPWRRLLLEKLPFVAGSAVFTAATIWAHTESNSLATAEALPLGSRLTNVLTSYGIYLQQMVWPTNLSILYRHPQDVDVVAAVTGAVLLIALSVLAWLARRRRPQILWGLLWYLATLFPVAGIFATGSEASADRFAYVSLLGPFVAIAWLSFEWGRRAIVPAVAVLLIFAAATVQQIGIWRDSFSLFRRVMEVNPNSYRSVAMMAYMLSHIREYAAAEQMYRRATELNPTSAVPWDGLGGVLQKMGRVPEAIVAVRKALEIDPKQVVSRCNLAAALEATDDLAAAESEWRRVLKSAPDLPLAHLRLGLLLTKRGAHEEARQLLARAAALDPASKEIATALAAVQEVLSR